MPEFGKIIFCCVPVKSDLLLLALLYLVLVNKFQACAFWRCIDTDNGDDETDDSGALAAVGCLRAISTILESISSLPHLYGQIEPQLLPIMRKMLTTDGQGMHNVLETPLYRVFSHFLGSFE